MKGDYAVQIFRVKPKVKPEPKSKGCQEDSHVQIEVRTLSQSRMCASVLAGSVAMMILELLASGNPQ